ncbi:MAG: peptidase M20, partial [Bacteroidetes bacterium]
MSQSYKQIEVNTERLTSILIDLCKIPSPSGKEHLVADYIRNYTAKYELEVNEDKAGIKLNGSCGNLTISVPGNNKEGLFLSAHMDTVKVPEVEEIPVIRTKD